MKKPTRFRVEDGRIYRNLDDDYNPESYQDCAWLVTEDGRGWVHTPNTNQEVVSLANEAKNWKQIAMDDSETLDAAEAFIESKGLTMEWNDYDHEKTTK